MTRLFLIRHGQTDWIMIGRFQGVADVPLNDTGRGQARALGERLAGTSFHALYVSDLSRARETALLVAGDRAIPQQFDPRLREADQGELEGCTADDLLARFPDFYAQWRVAPATVRIPGGETLTEVQARMIAVVSEILAAHRGETVGVVSHNLALKMVLCHAQGLPVEEFRRFHLGECALSLAVVKEGRWTLELINSVAHWDPTRP